MQEYTLQRKSRQSQRIRPNSNWLSHIALLCYLLSCASPRIGTAKKTACSFKKPNLLKIQLRRWWDARICTEDEVFLKLTFSLEKKLTDFCSCFSDCALIWGSYRCHHDPLFFWECLTDQSGICHYHYINILMTSPPSFFWTLFQRYWVDLAGFDYHH